MPMRVAEADVAPLQHRADQEREPDERGRAAGQEPALELEARQDLRRGRIGR